MDVESRYECSDCGHQDAITETRNELCASVNEDTNIQKLIEKSVAPEILDKTCSICGNKRAMKTEAILRYPQALLVVLKRYVQEGNTFKKVNCNVYPSFTLDAGCLRAPARFEDHLENKMVRFQLTSSRGTRRHRAVMWALHFIQKGSAPEHVAIRL